MRKIITWFTKDNSIKEIVYSDISLIETIRRLATEIDGFDTINMWFMQNNEISGCIAIDIGTEEVKLGNHITLNVYDFNLQEESFGDYVAEGQRIKMILKRKFKKVKVKSNFR